MKYFNAEAFENDRYRQAVSTYQNADYQVDVSQELMSVSQNLVFVTGLLVACMYAAWQISNGYQKIGLFVAILTLMSQLQQPLNYFSDFYRQTQSKMINAERMLELFRIQPTVVDDPQGVATHDQCDGDIVFEDVHFAYKPTRPGLQGFSFHAPPGTTTAIVGESGNGKTTIFRLLYRFYNVQSGRILVDGADVLSMSCLLYTSPSPRDGLLSRMPSSA